MRRSKKERQQLLKQKITENPFITDEALADTFCVSVQTMRLDRLELSIPELRERIKHVAIKQFDTVKALPIEEVIGEIIDLQLDQRAISILDIGPEHVFSRTKIARGHHVFAQANSLAVAIIDDELALTAKANVRFSRMVNQGERIVAKAKMIKHEKERTIVEVTSYVEQELVFSGQFHVYRSEKNVEGKKGEHEDSN
jgi:acyl-coenzyme A thioesterase PaaI-like protein